MNLIKQTNNFEAATLFGPLNVNSCMVTNADNTEHNKTNKYK